MSRGRAFRAGPPHHPPAAALPLCWLASRGGSSSRLPACAAGAAAWLLRKKPAFVGAGRISTAGIAMITKAER